jgi:hypothetical protein
MQKAGFYMLPQEAIEEFKKLYKARFKVDLSDEEASFRANNLVNLYEAVYGTSLGKTAGRNHPSQE